MRTYISLVENFDNDNYFMSEGCGVFAYALWLLRGKPLNGDIGIISNIDGEPWFGDDSDYPTHEFEATHVFYIEDDLTMDIMGNRSTNDMISDFGIHAEVHGPYNPEYFKNEWMGDTDYYPLYYNNDMLREAMEIINNNKELYRIVDVNNKAS